MEAEKRRIQQEKEAEEQRIEEEKAEARRMLGEDIKYYDFTRFVEDELLPYFEKLRPLAYGNFAITSLTFCLQEN